MLISINDPLPQPIYIVIFSALMSESELATSITKTIDRKYNILIAFSDSLAQHKYHFHAFYNDVIILYFMVCLISKENIVINGKFYKKIFSFINHVTKAQKDL